MQEIISIEQLDLAKQYSYADYFSWKIQDRLELIRGYIMKTSAPNRVHQTVSMNLIKNIVTRFDHKSCQVYHAPFDVRLPKGEKKGDKEIFTVVQPDICIVCDSTKLDDRGCIGAPEVIFEILSPSNPKHDLEKKFKLYEEFGVCEYWIVFPGEKVLQRFNLENGAYNKGVWFSIDEIATSLYYPKFDFSVNEIFLNL